MSEFVELAWIDFEDEADRDRWLDHARDFMSATIAEPGCLRFAVYPDPNSSTRVFGHGLYDSAAAFQAHVAGEHTATFRAMVSECRVREKSIKTFEVLGDLRMRTRA